MASWFDMFTDSGRKVLVFAQDEAQRYNHTYIGTEHLLLGLVRVGDGVAARVLGNMGVQLPKVRSAVEHIIGRSESTSVGKVRLTSNAKKSIELAMSEARRLHHRFVSTEHLLLGVLGVPTAVAFDVLERLDVHPDEARAQVLRVISPSGFAPTSAPSRSERATRFSDQFDLIKTVVPLRPEPALNAPADDDPRPLTDPARLAIERARSEAVRLDHDYIGTVHLLLGLVADPASNAAVLLKGHGVELAKARSAVESIIGRGESSVMDEIEFTPRAKEVVELADVEAKRLGHAYLGTEHLLLSLLREPQAVADGLIESMGANVDTLKVAMLEGLVRGANKPLSEDAEDNAWSGSCLE